VFQGGRTALGAWRARLATCQATNCESQVVAQRIHIKWRHRCGAAPQAAVRRILSITSSTSSKRNSLARGGVHDRRRKR
jgi:hypothetical protein